MRLAHDLVTQDASMSTDIPVPTPLIMPVHCAPKKVPCPECGKLGRRTRTLTRTVRTVAYKTIAFLEIHYGEYHARCGCSTTFRNTPEGVLPKAKYDNKVRDLVLERILEDGMSIERVLQSLQREFLLDLSSGFVYDVLHDFAAGLDMAAHRRKVGCFPHRYENSHRTHRRPSIKRPAEDGFEACQIGLPASLMD
jgi:hypothetical protein